MESLTGQWMENIWKLEWEMDGKYMLKYTGRWIEKKYEEVCIKTNGKNGKEDGNFTTFLIRVNFK